LMEKLFKGLNTICRILPDRIPGGSGLVYGGDEPQRRTGVTIVPVKRIDDLFNIACE
jgi:hypothetical protein